MEEKEEIIKQDYFKIKGGKIPIKLMKYTDIDGEYFTIDIDGVEWLETLNYIHAGILYKIMLDNITKYMNYVYLKK